MSSSKIYSERKSVVQGHNSNTPTFLIDSWKYEVAEADKLDQSWPDSLIYLENVRNVFPHLKRLYFTGGEPMLIKSNLVLLKELLQTGNRNLMVSFTTNLTVWNNELMDILSKFERIEFTCSIDGYGDANSYIRHPSKWDMVIDNLKRMLKLPRSSMSIMTVIQNSNVFSYIDLLYWLKKENLMHLNLIPTMLHSPNYLRAEVLSDDVRAQARARLRAAIEDPKMPNHFKPHLQSIDQQILAPHFENDLLLSKFKDYINYLDQSRELNYSSAFPEFKSIFVDQKIKSGK